jgi:DNA-binding transcriptional MerR regulator
MYSIKELADLAGVTTRTLRYYDQVGLLPPTEIGNNGYRYYDRESLIRLQQILFYRELDLPLKEIGIILGEPDFAVLEALEDHQVAIQRKIVQYKKLLGTVQKTINSLKGVEKMSDHEYFEGFDEKLYEKEARERWDGPQFEESQRNWSSFSKKKQAAIKIEGGEITQRMVTEDPDAKPDHPSVQQAVADYHRYINQYFYSCDTEHLRLLADMWVEDPRFKENYERIREGGAAFVREAVHIFSDRALAKGG